LATSLVSIQQGNVFRRIEAALGTSDPC
jgi:hypothetical protein